ncbi:MAG: PA0069 family radical SAM protein [Saprospiraceae bacterium]|nr:PA0069 family radical SAM protein [Saprospiraceae bacterium]
MNLLPVIQNGRGAQINTPNSFQKYNVYVEELTGEEESIQTTFQYVYPKTIVNKVESPDLPLYYSLNPYQGCEHGCIYCYARNTHNYWGYSAGLDFESKILVKKNAPELLDKLLSSKKWKAAPIMLSGNTDCYQPIEKDMEITRELLKVFLKHRHPVGIVTKNTLLLRDLDLLKSLNDLGLVSVAISINTVDDDLRRKMEPRTATIKKRLELLEVLNKERIPVTVLAAPIIPGLNDSGILSLAKKVAATGVKRFHHMVVRLNGDVGPIFEDWLSKTYADRSEKVLNKIKSLHGGQLNDSTFGRRMKGEGVIADIINQQVALAKKLYLLHDEPFQYNTSLYRAPKTMQLSLF